MNGFLECVCLPVACRAFWRCAPGGSSWQRSPASLSAGTVGVGRALADSPPLEIVSSSVVLSPAEQTATFDLQFNHAPDFYTLDSAGRSADSFQYFVNPNWGGNTQDLQLQYGQFRDVVRGDEIRTSGKLLVRDATFPAHPDSTSGGWGPVIAALPFDVKGSNLTFTATYNDLRAERNVFIRGVHDSFRHDGEHRPGLGGAAPSGGMARSGHARRDGCVYRPAETAASPIDERLARSVRLGRKT